MKSTPEKLPETSQKLPEKLPAKDEQILICLNSQRFKTDYEIAKHLVELDMAASIHSAYPSINRVRRKYGELDDVKRMYEEQLHRDVMPYAMKNLKTGCKDGSFKWSKLALDKAMKEGIPERATQINIGSLQVLNQQLLSRAGQGNTRHGLDIGLERIDGADNV